MEISQAWREGFNLSFEILNERPATEDEIQESYKAYREIIGNA